MSDLKKSHEKILFGFTLVIKLRNFDFKSYWNTLIFFDKKYIWRQIGIYPMEKCLILFHFHCFASHFSQKTEKFWFWRPLKYFNFLSKKWCHIRIYPAKQCPILFKLRCLNRILVISWEILVLNVIERV